VISRRGPLKEIGWVRDHLGDPKLVIVDCRYNLSDTDYGQHAYENGHIPGAYFVDLLRDMTGKISKNGGRHPLPDLDLFVKKLESFGITEDSTVVAYDDNWSGAARFYFLMQYIGFENSYVLNGLYQNWVNLGYPTDKSVPGKRRGKLSILLDTHIRLDIDHLRKGIDTMNLVDCRSSDRYAGENETIDPVAGHIPGAVNHPFMESVNDSGYLDKSLLEKKFSDLPNDPVLYCGSGVTACVNFVAMRVAGKDPRVYCGSWSDWISYPENPVEK
jgi:thiosulfate/3-mercaptopyruvate sulfurtransferase